MPNMIAPLPSCFRSVRTNIHFNIRLPLPNSHQKRGFTNLSSGDVKDNPGTDPDLQQTCCTAGIRSGDDRKAADIDGTASEGYPTWIL